MHKQADKTPVPRYKPYKGPAGGWGALISVTQAWLTSDNALKNLRMMLKTNQPDGFDCPGCAWPDREHASTFEFCENGVKADSGMASSAMPASPTPSADSPAESQPLTASPPR